MNQISPTIRFMTPEETRTNRLINAGSVIDYEGTTIPIAAGRSDQIHVFREATILYVLSINYRHEYIGLEIFAAKSGEEYDSIFIQNNQDIKEYLSNKWESMKPVTIVQRLISY